LLRCTSHSEINRLASFRFSPLRRRATTGALVLVLGLALGLAGCGRKGPLDPPPGASLDGDARTSNPGSTGVTPIDGQNVDDRGVGPDGLLRAPKGPNKRIPLDVLLN
jgi:predicted small lipoprotein YifL